MYIRNPQFNAYPQLLSVDHPILQPRAPIKKKRKGKKETARLFKATEMVAQIYQ